MVKGKDKDLKAVWGTPNTCHCKLVLVYCAFWELLLRGKKQSDCCPRTCLPKRRIIPSAAPVTSRLPLWLKAVQFMAMGSGSRENWSWKAKSLLLNWSLHFCPYKPLMEQICKGPSTTGVHLFSHLATPTITKPTLPRPHDALYYMPVHPTAFHQDILAKLISLVVALRMRTAKYYSEFASFEHGVELSPPQATERDGIGNVHNFLFECGDPSYWGSGEEKELCSYPWKHPAHKIVYTNLWILQQHML